MLSVIFTSLFLFSLFFLQNTIHAHADITTYPTSAIEQQHLAYARNPLRDPFVQQLREDLAIQAALWEAEELEEEQRRLEEYLRRHRQQKQALQQQFRQDVCHNFVQQPALFDNDMLMLSEKHGSLKSACFVRRSQAEATIAREGIRYTEQQYDLSNKAVRLLLHSGIHQWTYQTCSGNHLQQALHRECIDLIEHAAQFEPNSLLFEYQSSLVYCIEAAHLYNGVGLTHKASIIADFCWSLLDYGKAIFGGVRDGLLSVARQALNDPLQTVAATTLSVAAGEYLLAYQLGKMVYGVLDLAVNAVINPKQARATWGSYLEPINNIIDALNNKELSLRDAIQAGTALAVSCKAQWMLAKGCGKLYVLAKTRALECAIKNSFVGAYDCKEFCGKNFFKVINQATECCPATCRGQYRKFKEALRREQFSAIVKCTEHGYERLIERRFEPQEVWDLVNNPHFVKMQANGAKALLRNMGDKYNIIIMNGAEEVVTALKDLDLANITRLGKKYGWML